MQKPTKGRIVLYTFPKAEVQGFTSLGGQTETVPAIIVSVINDELVNLRVFPDSANQTQTKTSVSLKGSVRHEASGDSFGFWEWPVVERSEGDNEAD